MSHNHEGLGENAQHFAYGPQVPLSTLDLMPEYGFLLPEEARGHPARHMFSNLHQTLSNSHAQPDLTGHTSSHRPLQIRETQEQPLFRVQLPPRGFRLDQSLGSQGAYAEEWPLSQSHTPYSTDTASCDDPASFQTPFTLWSEAGSSQMDRNTKGQGPHKRARTDSEISSASHRQRNSIGSYRGVRSTDYNQVQQADSDIEAAAQWNLHTLSGSPMSNPDWTVDVSEMPVAFVVGLVRYAARGLDAQPTVARHPDGSWYRNFDKLRRRLESIGDIPHGAVENDSISRTRDANRKSVVNTDVSDSEITKEYRGYRKVARQPDQQPSPTRSKKYRCTCGNNCRWSFDRKGDWIRHQCEHYLPYVWICPDRCCKTRVFVRKSRFKDHMTKVHNETIKDETVKDKKYYKPIKNSEHPKECRWDHCEDRFIDHSAWLAHDAAYLEASSKDDADENKDAKDSDPDAKGDEDPGDAGSSNNDQNPGASGGGAGASNYHGYSRHELSNNFNQSSGNSGQNSGYHHYSGFQNDYATSIISTYSQLRHYTEKRPWKQFAAYRLVLLPLSCDIPKTPVVLKCIQLHVALHVESNDMKTIQRTEVLRREIALMTNVLRESPSSACQALSERSLPMKVPYFRHSNVHQVPACRDSHHSDMDFVRFGHLIKQAPFRFLTGPQLPSLESRQARSGLSNTESQRLREESLSDLGLTRSSTTYSGRSELQSSLDNQTTVQAWLKWLATTDVPRSKSIIYSPQISVRLYYPIIYVV